MTFEIQKLPVHAPRDAPHELVAVYFKYPGEFRDSIDCSRQFLRVRPDAVDRRADRERFAVSIGNRSAMRSNLFVPQVPGVSLLVQEVSVEDLQMHGAREQRTGRDRKEHNHQ